MQKWAKFNWKAVGQAAGGGALTGASIAAVLNLIRRARLYRQEQIDKQEPETSEDTIVVTVPRRDPEEKAASTYLDPSTEPQSGSRVMDADADKDTPAGTNIAKGNATGIPGDIVINVQAESPSGDVFAEPNGNHPRNVGNGQYAHIPTTKSTQTTSPYVGKQSNAERGNSESMKGRVPVIMGKTAASWTETTAAILATMGAGALGASVVNKVFAMQREKELKKKLSDVQQEYAMQLTGERKAGEFIDALCGMPKQADAAGLIKLPLVVGGLVYALGAGSAAYVTKKILDEKFREAASAGRDLPRVRRIVFKTVSQPVAEKADLAEQQVENENALAAAEKAAGTEGVEIGPDTLLCLLAITDDHLTGTCRNTGTPLVKAAAAGMGLDLTKLALQFKPEDLASFSGMMEDPRYAPMIHQLVGGQGGLIDNYMRNRPVMRWFAPLVRRLPFAQHYVMRKGRNMMMDMARQMQGPQRSPTPTPAPTMPAGAPPMYAQSPRLPPSSAFGLPKQAYISVSTPGILAGMVGRRLVSGAEPEMAEQLLEAEEKVEKAKHNTALRRDPDMVVNAIRLEAKDPNAKLYLRKNKKRVQELLHEIAEHGQL